MHSFIERREFPRFKVSLPLRLKRMYGDVYVDDETVTKDLSKNGVRFESTFPITLNSRLLIELVLPTASDPARILSRVVWIKRLPGDENYEFGNEFLSMRDTDEAAISDYLKTLLP